MDASLANLRLQAGQMFAPLAGQIAQAAADSMGSLSDYIKEGLESGLTNTGEQLGYSLGVALKDGIIAALTNGEAVRDALIGIVTNFNIGTAGVEVGKQLAAGTKQALEENAGEITAVWTAAFSPTKAQELAGDLAHIKELFEDLHSAQQLYAQYKSDGDYLRMDSMSNAIQRVIAELAPLQNKVREATAAMGPLNNATERNASSAWAAVTGWQNLGGATSGAAGAQTAVVGPINDTTAALKAQADQAAATATALQGVFMAAVSALGANSAFALSQNAQQELRGMEELWVRRGVDPNKIPFLRTEFLDNQQARLQYLIEAPQRAAEETERLNKYWFENATNVDRANRSVRNWRDTVNASLRNTEEGGKQNILPTARMGLDVGGGGSGGGGVSESEIEQMVGDLRGRVQGVLGNALNVDVGVNPADFLPREDAVNEDARRLADVMVRGFESPWYEFLTQKFPGMFDGAGDIKEKAAQIMRDFQQGLRPELIDKETVKEQVKRMILGEASMSALADEIASELAGELGVSLAKAKDAVGAVMGVQEGDTSGAGSAIADGFAQATNGERMVQGMVERMETAYSRLYQSGVKAGHQWGTGFMSVMQSGLSPALIELLATLVTPAVLAQMAANGSRTGAE
jgi:hypothetical protein